MSDSIKKLPFAYSTNEEDYYGEFATVEDACAEAAADVGVGRSFWIGERVSPPQPETYFDIEQLIEHVSCQDEYSGDWAMGWDDYSKQQRDEINREVREVIGKWLDRHSMRPRFYNIENPRQFHVMAENPDGTFQVEEVK